MKNCKTEWDSSEIIQKSENEYVILCEKEDERIEIYEKNEN